MKRGLEIIFEEKRIFTFLSDRQIYWRSLVVSACLKNYGRFIIGLTFILTVNHFLSFKVIDISELLEQHFPLIIFSCLYVFPLRNFCEVLHIDKSNASVDLKGGLTCILVTISQMEIILLVFV